MSSINRQDNEAKMKMNASTVSAVSYPEGRRVHPQCVAPGFPDESTILAAAVNFNDLRVRTPFSGGLRSSISNSPALPSSPGGRQPNLAMLALSRSNHALTALRLANMRAANQLFARGPRSMPPSPTRHTPFFDVAAKRGLSFKAQQAMMSHHQAALATLLRKGPASPLKAPIDLTKKPTSSASPNKPNQNSEPHVEPSMVAPTPPPPPIKDTNEEALETLGATCLQRRMNKAPYFDASALRDPNPVTVANRRTRGGVTEPFPEKLYRMLMDAKKNGQEDIISFYPHGRAFGIHKPEEFSKEVMPKYFKQSRVSSFQRQLNLYGFTRINTGPDAGGYYHELFLRGRPALNVHIRRVGVPQAVPRRRGVKAHDSTIDPDFYNMPAITGARAEQDDNDKQRNDFKK